MGQYVVTLYASWREAMDEQEKEGGQQAEPSEIPQASAEERRRNRRFHGCHRIKLGDDPEDQQTGR
jgi:hypothetical protein